MYSFGALKTGTALGGALIKVRDRSVLQRMRDVQRSWPVQSGRKYAATVLKFMAFSLATRPLAYGALAWFHRTTGRDFDRLVNSSVRAFRPGRLLPQLEVQPSAPLLATMSFRLLSFDGVRIRRRAESGAWLAAHLPAGVRAPGSEMEAHTHWLFPVICSDPEALISACRLAGFDAARGASSVAPVAAPAGRPEAEPEHARRMMQNLVFLPAYPELSRNSLARLAQALELAESVRPRPAAAGRLGRA